MPTSCQIFLPILIIQENIFYLVAVFMSGVCLTIVQLKRTYRTQGKIIRIAKILNLTKLRRKKRFIPGIGIEDRLITEFFWVVSIIVAFQILLFNFLFY